MRYIILDILVCAVTVIVVALVASWGILHALDKRAVHQCHTWQVYAETYRTWYATNYERSQCAYYGIELPADRVQR